MHTAKIKSKYMVDNNVRFTATDVGGPTNSRSCFRLSVLKEKTKNINEFST